MIDDSTLDAMDILEGVRTGRYYKREVGVTLSDRTEELKCTAYFYPSNDELLTLDYLPEYTDEHHALYSPVPVSEEIIDLCRRQGEHVLCTCAPSNMLVHCLRLLPGEDLLLSLLKFVNERRIEAAIVVTCVGSTGKTTLRPAGVPTPRVFEGKHEIVSLTGTLSEGCGGHHLHMSISDSQCNVFGGHVLEGCIVRTTAEIALGQLPGVRFERPQDERTGYDELSILPTRQDQQLESSKRRRTATDQEN